MTASIAPDDPARRLLVVDPEDAGLQHLGVVGDTYTVLVSGADTAGRYALLDMLVPPGGGPPPHRHDFEEQFHVLEGEIVVTFRGEPVTARAGMTVNVPALAPHSFINATDRPARMLCLVSPAGIEEFFAAVGDALPTRTAAAPELGEAELKRRIEVAGPLAQRLGIEPLGPDEGLDARELRSAELPVVAERGVARGVQHRSRDSGPLRPEAGAARRRASPAARPPRRA